MMGHHLTDNSVRILPLPSKGTKSWSWEGDTAIGGFGVKLYENGRRVFALRYRTQEGRQRMLTIGGSLGFTVEEARKVARTVKQAVALGKDPCEARDDEVVLLARCGEGAHKGKTRLYARMDGNPSLSEIAQKWMEEL